MTIVFGRSGRLGEIDKTEGSNGGLQKGRPRKEKKQKKTGTKVLEAYENLRPRSPEEGRGLEATIGGGEGEGLIIGSAYDLHVWLWGRLQT